MSIIIGWAYTLSCRTHVNIMLGQLPCYNRPWIDMYHILPERRNWMLWWCAVQLNPVMMFAVFNVWLIQSNTCKLFLQRGRIACNAERCYTYSNSIRPSVRLSVTRWYPIQKNEDRITRSSLLGSKNTLVFWYKEWLWATTATSPST